eukprot:COSAG01_NODE_12877_length_1671_cov_2.489822_2_plen_350_part_01
MFSGVCGAAARSLHDKDRNGTTEDRNDRHDQNPVQLASQQVQCHTKCGGKRKSQQHQPILILSRLGSKRAKTDMETPAVIETQMQVERSIHANGGQSNDGGSDDGTSMLSRGDLLAVRCNTSDRNENPSGDPFWLCVCLDIHVDTAHQAFTNVQWWQVPLTAGGMSQRMCARTKYLRGAKDTIEVMSVLCVLRKASTTSPLVLTSVEWCKASEEAEEARKRYNWKGGSVGTDEAITHPQLLNNKALEPHDHADKRPDDSQTNETSSYAPYLYTEAEDRQICKMVEAEGPGNWEAKARRFVNRSGASLRNRWRRLKSLCVSNTAIATIARPSLHASVAGQSQRVQKSTTPS